MRKTLLIGCAITLLALHVRGQEVARFDTVRFNQAGSFSLGSSVFEIDSGYRVFGIQKGLPDLSQDIYVTAFDGNGGVISEQTFETYQQDWFGSASPIVAVSNGYFAGVNRFGVLGPLDSLFLYRFNSEGDTLWTRFIAVDTTYTMRGLARMSNGDLLISGLHHPPIEAYVYRVDSLGSIKSYNAYAGFDPEAVEVGLDGSWYVCGQGNTGPNYGYPILIRSDTSGNELWRRSDALYGIYFGTIPTRDSCIVAIGYHADGVTGPLAKVIKYNTAGVQQWVRELRQSTVASYECRLHAGYEREDSTFIVAGTMRDTTYGQAGMVFHLDSEGNTLWQRFYAHYPNFNLNQSQIFWDVKPTSDGGMVLTGETNSDDYPYAQLWLLKLDSSGCLVPGCGSVGVEEYLDALQPLLHVSPNPSSNVVNVALDLPEGAAIKGEVRLVLLDATCRIVLEQKVQQSFNALRGTIDVSALSSGTYYLHLRDAKSWLAGAKVIVQ